MNCIVLFPMDAQNLSSQVNPLKLKTTIIIDASNDGVYAFDVRGSVDGNILACSSSNQLIKLYDIQTSRFITQLKGHTDTISDIIFSTSNPHFLYSCSHDGYAALWDTRQSSAALQFVPQFNEFFNLSEEEKKEMYSLSVGMEDQLLAVGSDPFIYFWDIKGGKLLTTYSDSHTNEVTQVRFHPFVRTRLFSASLDELVCSFEFDVNKFLEDDTFSSVYNIGQPITKIGFFGTQGEYLYALTSTESLSLWNLQLESKVVDFGTTLRENLSRSVNMTIDYFIDCFFSHSDQKFLLFGGSHDGTVLIFVIKNQTIELIGVLHDVNGHIATVRSFYCHPKEKLIITAGEDARICFWHPNETNDSFVGANVIYQPQQISNSSVRFHPY